MNDEHLIDQIVDLRMQLQRAREHSTRMESKWNMAVSELIELRAAVAEIKTLCITTSMLPAAALARIRAIVSR